MAELYPAIGEEATAAVTTPPDVAASLTGILHEMLENSVLQSPNRRRKRISNRSCCNWYRTRSVSWPRSPTEVRMP